MSTILTLFWSFCQIGFTSFGGLSMIPLINSEMTVHNWMTAEEVSDIVAIAEMTPGPVGLNCATFAGIRVGGMLGALAATLGILMPTFTICVVAAFFFERFKNGTTIKNIMIGVRPVCVGMIWAVILNLMKTNYFLQGILQWNCVLIGGIATVLLVKFKWKIPMVILLSAVMGILLT